MRNFFVAAFLILFLLVVTSATPKQKCHTLSKSCSSRRKCCKGLECAPKGYKRGKRCIEKQSSPTSNEDDAEIIARNNVEMTFTGLFDTIKSKVEVIKGDGMLKVQFVNAITKLATAGDDLYGNAEVCDFVFNENTNVMMAVQNASGATSKAATLAENNIALIGLAVTDDMKAEATWLRDALKDVSSYEGCNASAIATSKAKFDASATEAIKTLTYLS